MSEMMLPEPVELTDTELDAVAAGHGLVHIDLTGNNIEILKNIFVDVEVEDSIKDIANNNQVSVGAIIQLLGGRAGILQNQA
jgi:hypothetical protein